MTANKANQAAPGECRADDQDAADLVAVAYRLVRAELDAMIGEVSRMDRPTQLRVAARWLALVCELRAPRAPDSGTADR